MVKAAERMRDRLIRAYRATVGETDGNIIAAIITTQTPRNQTKNPRAVQGPLSIPRISPAVHHQPKAANANRTATIPRWARVAAYAGRRLQPVTDSASVMTSSGPGEVRLRQAGLSLVGDAESVDPGALRLSHHKVRPDRVEHSGEPHRLTRLDTEGHDVLDLEVDHVVHAHAVQQSVVLDVDCCALHAEHLSDQ